MYNNKIEFPFASHSIDTVEAGVKYSHEIPRPEEVDRNYTLLNGTEKPILKYFSEEYVPVCTGWMYSQERFQDRKRGTRIDGDEQIKRKRLSP